MPNLVIGNLKLNKCCPQNQQLYLDHFDNLKCTNFPQNIFGDTSDFNETNDANISHIWWIPDNLNLIKTNNEKSEINIVEGIEIVWRDFIFDQPIPCFKHDPEVLLIQSNVFIDMNSSELILTQLETVPEYTAESFEGAMGENKERFKRLATRQQKEHRREQNMSTNDEKYQKNLRVIERNLIKKRQTVEEVEIVRNNLRGITKINQKRINSRFSSDMFCIDRIAFKTDDNNAESKFSF